MSSGEFLGLYETFELYGTFGFIVVGGDDDKMFFNYEYDKEKSEILYSHFRRRIPNSFSGTLFNHHKETIESGELESEHLQLFFFVLSITDRSNEVNQYQKNINIYPIDLTQNNFNQWLEPGHNFKKNYFDLLGEKKKRMRECVVNALKRIVLVSNPNLVMNADGLLFSREEDIAVDWRLILQDIAVAFHLRNLRQVIDLFSSTAC